MRWLVELIRLARRPPLPLQNLPQLQDVEPIPSDEQLGYHLALTVTRWQLARTEEEREHWSRYLVMCVRACRPRWQR